MSACWTNGFALREDGDVRWISIGLRCLDDHALGVYGPRAHRGAGISANGGLSQRRPHRVSEEVSTKLRNLPSAGPGPLTEVTCNPSNAYGPRAGSGPPLLYATPTSRAAPLPTPHR